MDCSLPGSSIHGIFQARVSGVGCHCLLHWVILAWLQILPRKQEETGCGTGSSSSGPKYPWDQSWILTTFGEIVLRALQLGLSAGRVRPCAILHTHSEPSSLCSCLPSTYPHILIWRWSPTKPLCPELLLFGGPELTENVSLSFTFLYLYSSLEIIPLPLWQRLLWNFLNPLQQIHRTSFSLLIDYRREFSIERPTKDWEIWGFGVEVGRCDQGRGGREGS